MTARLQDNMAERAKQARRVLQSCQLCPRKCGVNRLDGQVGFCGVDGKLHCFREMVFYGEEEGLNPSHQVYFAGCNLRCEFCTVAEWNEEPLEAEVIDMRRLKTAISQRQKEGARTLNLLGGEPAVSVVGILELLSQIDLSAKVVWNSNMYYDQMVGELIEGVVDICLADLKCGNKVCANALLSAADYVEVAKQNIVKAGGYSELIVRHVILPGHQDCCLKPVLRWLADEAPNAKVSLRGDYVPPAEAAFAPTEYLDTVELHDAKEMAKGMGLRVIE